MEPCDLSALAPSSASISTFFYTVPPRVVFPAPGKLRHAGAPVTAGRRYIIPLFCYLDANKSGKRPGYMLDSLGLDVPDTSAAKLSRYASALVS